MKKKILLLFLCVLLLCPISVLAYYDVPTDKWYADSVKYVTSHALMGGVGNGNFDPDGTVSRAMLVTVLYRMEGSPAASKEAPFADVKSGSYYASAVAWAAQSGIVNGVSKTKFAPDDSVTREQLAAILCRYAEGKGQNVRVSRSLTQYKDASQISAYAVDAMRWANAAGYITGTTANTLSPKGTTTRAQLAVILTRYANSLQADAPADAPEQAGNEKPKHQNDEPKSVNPTLKAESVSAKPGEQVTVNVGVENNPGILGMTLTVSFDEKNLTLVSAENGTAVDALTFIPSKSLKSGCSFAWYGTSLNDGQIRDGSVLKLTFEVSGNASGSLPVILTASNGDIIDRNLDTVGVILQNGSIRIG